MRKIKKIKQDADLDITSFMNLMIVLVPVLLLNMVFSQTVVLEIKLPAAAQSAINNPQENQQIEIITRDDYLLVNYPAGIAFAKIDNKADQYDYKALSLRLQALKKAFIEKSIEKKDILILLQDNTDYQALVTLMDTVRAYQPESLFDTVTAELFPDISLGDAPILKKSNTIAGSSLK